MGGCHAKITKALREQQNKTTRSHCIFDIQRLHYKLTGMEDLMGGRHAMKYKST